MVLELQPCLDVESACDVGCSGIAGLSLRWPANHIKDVYIPLNH